MLNLLNDTWFPVVTRSGVRRIISPAELTAGFATDPIVEIGWPRPDFRAATLEFLIGLLSTACPPEDNASWHNWANNPPSPEILKQKLQDYAPAFNFDGDGPRFLQDFSLLDAEESPISALLIDQPGANAEKNNTDLFVKRGKVQVIARSTAAIALFTLQNFAPSGGAGHRTGLRGGGPLTTLLRPDENQPTLWSLIWLNVLTIFDADDVGAPLEDPERTFPWLGPTRTSNEDGKVASTHSADVHPAQSFWGMPRRIRLIFEHNEQNQPCDICGAIEPVIVRRFVMQAYGVNYGVFRHPLTPYYRVKAGSAELLPVHPQPGGIAYRHWLSFVQASDTRFPALCVAKGRDRLRGKGSLLLLGYDLDNMKARGFVEAQKPLFFASTEEKQQSFERHAARLVDVASEVSSLLLGQIKAAKGRGGEDLDLVREVFFKKTELDFFIRLEEGLKAIETTPGDADLSNLGVSWLNEVLVPAARNVFSNQVNADAVVASTDMNAIGRAAKAQGILEAALRGYGPVGAKIFKALELSVPKTVKNPDKKTKKDGK